jgi:signal transduction histidine kinase
MLKGKGVIEGKGLIVFNVLKVFLYCAGYIEFLIYSRPAVQKTQIILASIIVINGFLRQFYLYQKDNLYSYGMVSIILDFALGAYSASLLPVFVIIIFLTPTIFESVAAYSLIFGSITCGTTVVTLMIIDILSQKYIPNYFNFFMSMFVSYVLGFVLIFIISYLASLQFREREKVARTNKELEQAYKQLLDNASELQELSIEKERTRMAREIHDTLAHTLTAVVVQMEACKRLIDVDVSRAKVEIEKAQELTRAGLYDVKRTIKALRPQILENSSLNDALNNLIKDIEENAHVKVNFHDSLLQELNLSSSAEVALFRVIQESITNAIRHGGAEQIDIFMDEKDNMVIIRICDNGRGCTHIKEGYGLKGIIERVRGLSGTVHLSSTAGKGFQTQIAILYKGGITCDN